MQKGDGNDRKNRTADRVSRSDRAVDRRRGAGGNSSCLGLWRGTCGAACHIPVDSEMVMEIHAVSEVLREEISGQLDKLLEMAKEAEVVCKAVVEEAYQPDKAIV